MKPYKWCRYCDKVPSECKCARPSIVITESEALDWFESLLQPVVAPAGTKHFDPFNAREIYDTTAVNEKLSRLRALIAAERGKV